MFREILIETGKGERYLSFLLSSRTLPGKQNPCQGYSVEGMKHRGLVTKVLELLKEYSGWRKHPEDQQLGKPLHMSFRAGGTYEEGGITTL